MTVAGFLSISFHFNSFYVGSMCTFTFTFTSCFIAAQRNSNRRPKAAGDGGVGTPMAPYPPQFNPSYPQYAPPPYGQPGADMYGQQAPPMQGSGKFMDTKHLFNGLSKMFLRD